ncbi:class I SAM-dependent methyltransferase [Streptomyces beihaiensis]|uniref:Class I SAM-dependent methyltransferase n=1 Tax=Streptomyces beihaiensis TaxID=2984495 RepID=A0ABT3U0R3_9ACTN|nr:class I SAM-dependent methyltransferase [Streptomyces beihaiensis]MCX3062640.1 class I SAM-dependent methyltransferase [Streptomyces beihaiensis]
MTTTSRARSFDRAAARYAAGRPSYPASVLDAVEEACGRTLAGLRAVDVGAGTGIASTLLRGRGADVLAVEPGDGMAAEFRRTLPGVPLVRGDGNALPLATGSADLITYAQSWHWTDTARAVPEALRVLRPGGVLALWWNTGAPNVPWLLEQDERIADLCGIEPEDRPHPDAVRALRLAGLEGLSADRRLLPWSRSVDIDTHLDNITSHSVFLVLDDPGRVRAFRDAERALLAGLFPDGRVEEAYLVDLLTVVRP